MEWMDRKLGKFNVQEAPVRPATTARQPAIWRHRGLAGVLFYNLYLYFVILLGLTCLMIVFCA